MRFAKARTSAVPERPADFFLVLVRAGLLFAIVTAGAVAMSSFKASKECRGAFSRGFSGDFDTFRCELKLRLIGGPELTLPLPV
jgi:hypothetical protein